MSTFLVSIFSVNSLSVRRPIFALCPKFAATKFIYGIWNSFFLLLSGLLKLLSKVLSSAPGVRQFCTPKTAPKDPTVAPTTSLTATKTVPKDPTVAPSTSICEKLQTPNSYRYLGKNSIQMGDSTFTFYPSCCPLCHSEREGKHLSLTVWFLGKNLVLGIVFPLILVLVHNRPSQAFTPWAHNEICRADFRLSVAILRPIFAIWCCRPHKSKAISVRSSTVRSLRSHKVNHVNRRVISNDGSPLSKLKLAPLHKRRQQGKQTLCPKTSRGYKKVGGWM